MRGGSPGKHALDDARAAAGRQAEQLTAATAALNAARDQLHSAHEALIAKCEGR